MMLVIACKAHYTLKHMRRPSLQNLELHVAHSCNLACESCSHYSNQGHKGHISPEEAGEWMAHWSYRLMPEKFTLLGGEPAINPRLAEFVGITRRHWPKSLIRLVSNGFLLDRHPDLPGALAEAGNTVLEISIHHISDAYRERIEPVIEMLRQWQQTHKIWIRLLPSYGGWTRRYKGFGAAMEPFEDQAPRQSWENCAARYCPQLFEGKIWKCPALAYLRMQDGKHGLSEKWQRYLTYEPLDPGCSDEELEEFFDREEEPVCSMCPAKPERFTLPLPYPAKPSREPQPA